ncbi:nitric oxide synthase oxygenase [Alkalihalobacillus pseudalcaliphilus]|uniref:nitric oxide synthase oxygenase n=1 Tax=Alkalihalobacillus pseudalcaliphilus TaxID=79884 RepID=UPI00069E63FF|nr:nitric oxide synthase oxygenase [Alkalihalobacillus pseudalcaliphilus]
MYSKKGLLEEAETFLHSCYQELSFQSKVLNDRLSEVQQQIHQEGTYTHTYEELAHGAKMAWRNSNKCIGRLFWDSMQVRDARDAVSIETVFAEIWEHIKSATNNGKILPTITVFQPETSRHSIKILNHQLFRYAGYETELGIIGDPASIELTKVCLELGWQGKQQPFELLPIVVQISDKLYFREIPEGLVLEVPIEHPTNPLFEELQLKWYAVPIISDMVLEIGGIRYPCAPFNGWYMGTEIAARNFADPCRYDQLSRVAELFHLDQSRESHLWRDEALVELNKAVLFSYKKFGVSIVDHHTAAKQFKRFEEREAKANRELTGDWTWLIPPLSPATTHIFHQQYKNKIVNPNYYREDELV